VKKRQPVRDELADLARRFLRRPRPGSSCRNSLSAASEVVAGEVQGSPSLIVVINGGCDMLVDRPFPQSIIA